MVIAGIVLHRQLPCQSLNNELNAKKGNLGWIRQNPQMSEILWTVVLSDDRSVIPKQQKERTLRRERRRCAKWLQSGGARCSFTPNAWTRCWITVPWISLWGGINNTHCCMFGGSSYRCLHPGYTSAPYVATNNPFVVQGAAGKGLQTNPRLRRPPPPPSSAPRQSCGREMLGKECFWGGLVSLHLCKAYFGL